MGDGFAAAALSGEENADEMNKDGFTSNHAGGVLGGISTGQDIVVRFAVKPTSQILTPRPTVTSTGAATHNLTNAHHATCVRIRTRPLAHAL